MSIYNQLAQSLEESSKDFIQYSDQFKWHSGKVCIPSDARPCFVCHSDSFKSPGRIAYYTPEDGWYRVVEKKNKIKIRTPKRWCEALIPETYKAFVEATTASETPEDKIQEETTDNVYTEMVMSPETKKVLTALARQYTDYPVVQTEPGHEATHLSEDWYAVGLIIPHAEINSFLKQLGKVIKQGKLGPTEEFIDAIENDIIVYHYEAYDPDLNISGWDDIPDRVPEEDSLGEDDHYDLFTIMTDGQPTSGWLSDQEKQALIKYIK